MLFGRVFISIFNSILIKLMNTYGGFALGTVDQYADYAFLCVLCLIDESVKLVTLCSFCTLALTPIDLKTVAASSKFIATSVYQYVMFAAALVPR